MKVNIRALGIDDGPFSFGDEHADLVGVLCRGPQYVEAIMRDRVTVDGTDSTQRIVRMIRGTGYLEQINVVFVDGGSVGGFNVFDIDLISQELGVPVITVSRKFPDFGSIRHALEKHFVDWEDRFDLISRGSLEPILNDAIEIYMKMSGTDRIEAGDFIRTFTVQGGIPEPLRMAHMIGTILKRNVTSGRA